MLCDKHEETGGILVTRFNKLGGVITATVTALATVKGVEPVLAQEDSGPVTVEVSECLELESPEERLACFESRVDTALEEGSAAPPAESSVTTDPRDADDGPGEKSEDAGRPGNRPEIVSTIAGLRETVPNSYIITLDNGQVWRQMRPKTYPLRIGHAVRIYPTNWGEAYRLTVEGVGSFIQVERVR
jgi:hypothetical protein